MPRRSNSFARALKDAEKRLEKAQAERIAAQTRLETLQSEIPAIRKTIEALEYLLNPASPPLRVGPIPPDTGQAPPPNLTPEELAKWYVNRDLSGVASVLPEKPVDPVGPVDEDTLLPDNFAVGKRD